MRKTIAAIALTVAAPISVATVTAVPAHAAVSHVTPSMRDTNWPCATC